MWGIVLVAATLVGPIALSLVFVPVVLFAALSGLRLTNITGASRPLLLALAVAVPLAGNGGPLLWAAVALAAVVAGYVLVRAAGHAEVWRVLVLVWGPAVASGAAVAAMKQDASLGALLVTLACLFDAANFVVGTGETGGYVGAAAGAGVVALVMVAMDSLVDADLRGRPMAVLALVAIVLLPVGIQLGRQATAGKILPAFRRFDSLLVAGPAWLVVMLVVLPH